MGLEGLALGKTDDLPIAHEGNVHNGKVRSVYWLTLKKSADIIERFGYAVQEVTPLGVMVISDRISAFNVNWHGRDGLAGVPGKGACLNAISEYWFSKFESEGIGGNHILEKPHPLVWIVQRANPIMVEGVARQYITGSMWRAYERGERNFCGNVLPDKLKKNQRLSELLLTPTTKGVLKGIPSVPEEDDIPITREQIAANYRRFGFNSSDDVGVYEGLIRRGFSLIESDLAEVGQVFVDTKFEMGYVVTQDGSVKMIYIDEVGTPDSSRMWDASEYQQGRVVENSKEGFRQFLLNVSGLDRGLLLDDSEERAAEKKALAMGYNVPVAEMMNVSNTYRNMDRLITGHDIPEIGNAREEILESLVPYGVVM